MCAHKTHPDSKSYSLPRLSRRPHKLSGKRQHTQWLLNQCTSYLDISDRYNWFSQNWALDMDGPHSVELDCYMCGSLTCNRLRRSLNKWSICPRLPIFHQLALKRDKRKTSHFFGLLLQLLFTLVTRRVALFPKFVTLREQTLQTWLRFNNYSLT